MKNETVDHLQIPDLLKTKKVLCIQPHPDDMEIGAGATVALLVKAGIPVSCLTITDGSIGTHDKSINPNTLAITRLNEAKRAATIMGVNEMIWLNFPDGKLPDQGLVREHITKTIRKVRPTAVIVNDPWLPYEAHSDHTITGLAAAEACLLSNMPHFYPEHLENELEPHQVKLIAFYYSPYPNTFFDVSTTWETKLSALACHDSQFPGKMMDEIKSILTQKAKKYGKLHDKKMVEAFKVLTPQHLHILEDAWRH